MRGFLRSAPDRQSGRRISATERAQSRTTACGATMSLPTQFGMASRSGPMAAIARRGVHVMSSAPDQQQAEEPDDRGQAGDEQCESDPSIGPSLPLRSVLRGLQGIGSYKSYRRNDREDRMGARPAREVR